MRDTKDILIKAVVAGLVGLFAYFLFLFTLWRKLDFEMGNIVMYLFIFLLVAFMYIGARLGVKLREWFARPIR